MYHREDSPSIEPPPLENSRLYYFAHGGVIESPPNTLPPLVEAYAAPTHRQLPQINPAVSEPSSPEVHWQSQHSADVSPVSETYGSAVSAYQSPVVPQSQSQYAHSTATSPVLSPVVSSYGSSLNTSTSYSSLASAEGYPSYEQQRMIHAPQPLVNAHTHSLPGPYTHPLHRYSSQSPAAVPVSRSFAIRHSLANIAAHAQAHVPQHHTQQQQLQLAYSQEPEPEPDLPSSPPSSHQSLQMPYTPFRENPGYAATQAHVHAEHYTVQPGMGNGVAADTAYAVYDAHGRLLAPAQGQYTLELAPVPEMQYHPPALAPPDVRDQKRYCSTPPVLTDFPSLCRPSHGHGHGGSESYPAAQCDSYPQYVQTPQQERYSDTLRPRRRPLTWTGKGR